MNFSRRLFKELSSTVHANCFADLIDQYYLYVRENRFVASSGFPCCSVTCAVLRRLFQAIVNCFSVLSAKYQPISSICSSGSKLTISATEAVIFHSPECAKTQRSLRIAGTTRKPENVSLDIAKSWTDFGQNFVSPPQYTLEYRNSGNPI